MKPRTKNDKSSKFKSSFGVIRFKGLRHGAQAFKSKSRINKANVPKETGINQQNLADKEGFVEVRNRRRIIGGQRNMGHKGNHGFNQGFRKEMGNRKENVKYAYQPKVFDLKPVIEKNLKSSNGNAFASPSKIQKIWKASQENRKLRESFDEFIKKKLQPNCIETKDWTYDMIQYFKYQWKAMERMEEEVSEEEDVFDSHNQAVNSLIANEVGFKQKEIAKFITESKIHICALIETHLKTKGIGKPINSLDLEGHKRIVHDVPWVLMGDFNVTLKPEEHYNGSSVMTYDMGEFIDAINSLEKLDKIMVNDEFLGKFDQADGMFLPYLISDHSPAMLIIPDKIAKRKKSFRVVQKLKQLKRPLNNLNWNNGNIFEKVVILKEKLKKAQSDVDADPFNNAKREIASHLFEEYTVAAEDEIKLFHKKVKIHWLKAGDRNNAFFYRILKARKHKSRVESICGEDGKSYEGNEVPNQYLTPEEAEEMVREVTDAEIKAVLFDINFSKAARPDGYSACFYKKSWQIVGKEICLAVKEFFTCGKILREINATLIALVPKLDTSNRVSNFRPIACCNVLYKITIIKKSLDEFSKVSGLHPNLSKSTILFGSILDYYKAKMLQVLPLKCGKLPMKYLGVPLLAKRLRVKDCVSLIENVENMISCWRNKLLSYAGRV
ncbi:RNA-directed DNA polymerase, eukaryota, reverse transcriptase zinc-binding domain protein [Tanacetum coccineum]|uniref:RNA-directed DNA polymerase, eukaryota, reverse transcriptase zinc-binding domain protein n=1 Tax=Tanacetum coccineum TaxID=301880 RepID=A0ABQ5IC11_9ASTR